MYRYFVIVLVTIFSNFLFSQTITEPLQPGRNTLVHSAGLPEEYLLFVPDSATQIFFNPARAGSHKGSFIYFNYLSDYTASSYAYLTAVMDNDFDLVATPLPNFPSGTGSLAKGNVYNFPSVYEETYSSTKNPSFSFGSLIDCGDVKWLFTLSNGINTSETTREYKAANDLSSQTTTGFDLSTENSQSSADVSATVIKVSRITNQGNNNYALGLWGILYNYNAESSYRDDYIQRRVYRYTSSQQISNSAVYIDQESRRQSKQFAAGAEFSFTNTSTDYIGSLSYQFNKSPQSLASSTTNISSDTSIADDPANSTFRIYGKQLIYDENLEGNTSGAAFYNYLSHSVDWITPADNFFISVYAFYSGGDKSYSVNLHQATNSWFSSGSGSSSSIDTTIANQPGDFKSRNSGVHLSTGYALKFLVSDISILSGVKLLGIFRDVSDLSSSFSVNNSSGVSEFNYKEKSAALVLPLYINYTPTSWVSLYGGINYMYSYRFRKYNITENFVQYNGGNTIINSRNIIDDNSQWQSSKSVYAGFELRHPSGLKIQTFFDESFTNINDWNISVGYHF